MGSRPFLLALDAQLAAMLAQIASIRSQIAPWIELQRDTGGEADGSRLPNPTFAAPGGPVGGSVVPAAHGPDASGNRAKQGAPASRVEAPAPSSSGAAALPRPAEPPGTRPPAEAPAKPAGASSHRNGSMTARLLDLMRHYAASGSPLPSDRDLAERFGATQHGVAVALARLRRRHGIVFERQGKSDRIVRFPGEDASPAVEKRDTAPADESRDAPPVAAAVEEVARFLRDACAMRVVALPGETFWLDGVKVDRAGLVARANARRRERGLPPFVLVGGAA